MNNKSSNGVAHEHNRSLKNLLQGCFRNSSFRILHIDQLTQIIPRCNPGLYLGP
jgi:hypothetical protein